MRHLYPFLLLIAALPGFSQETLPAGQNLPFIYDGRGVPQLLNGRNGLRFTLPDDTIYAAVRVQTITAGVSIDVLVRRGQDIDGTANDPVFDARDNSANPNKQVQIGRDSSLPIGSEAPYFVAFRAPEFDGPIAGIVRLEVRTLTPGGTRVEFSGFQEILLAGQPDGARTGDATAPLNSPPEPIAVTPGQGLRFEAIGSSQENMLGHTTGVEGDESSGEFGGQGGEFGLSPITGPAGVVVGVFTGPSIDSSLVGLIRPLDFHSEIRERLVVRPALQQLFAIGSGLNSSAAQRTYVVPPGATRLYLGRSRTLPAGAGHTLVRVERGATVPADTPANPLRLGAATIIELAGQPAGTEAGSNGQAPMHNPPQVGVNVVPGQALVFRASGSATNWYTGSVNGPAGDPGTDGIGSLGDLGISGYLTRPGALIGVFRGATIDRDNPPASINYSGPISNVTPLRPLVNQVFLIGDGKVADGSDRKVIVPAGADRLFVSHACGNEHQRGEFVVAVSAEVPDRPAYAKGDIVNAASLEAGPVSPGSIVSILGQNLGQQANAIDSGGVIDGFGPVARPLPRTLGGTQVYFDTIPAPLYFVSDRKVNVQVPWELGAARSAIVTVVRDGIPGVPVEIDLAPFRPALFAGSNRSAILVNGSNGNVVTPEAPARAGDLLTVYAIGLGLTTASPVTGEPGAADMLALAALPTRVILMGSSAQREVTPTYAGIAPGFVGVFQIQFSVPQGLGSGTVKLRLESLPFGTAPTVEFAVAE